MDAKYTKLIDYLKELDSFILAFSGGVDSTFLLKVAKEAVGNKFKAVTINSPYIPNWEIDEAKEYTKNLGVVHEFIETEIIESIRYNPGNRCYLCKKAIFNKIKERAKNDGYKHVIDGSNLDDLSDYRPGMKALKELGVVSPLLNCKINKDEIRKYSKALNLPTWNKPPYACLLTRIPAETEITHKTLKMIEVGEKYLMDRGIKAMRLRVHGELARIEIDPEQRNLLFDCQVMDEISETLKSIGFKFVTMELSGYKTGSLNQIE